MELYCRFVLTKAQLLYIFEKKRKYIAVLSLFMKEIGKQIAERRKKNGLTQQDLSEISGVSAKTINSIELGKANPSVNVLSKVVDPLGFVISLSERITHE